MEGSSLKTTGVAITVTYAAGVGPEPKLTDNGWLVDGKREGVWTFTSESGVTVSALFAGGSGPEVAWHPYGWLVDGKKEGVWTRWDRNGNGPKTETYKNGELVK